MSSVIATLVAQAIRHQDGQLRTPYGIEARDAEDLARAAIGAYGDALAAAGLAIVPLAAAERARGQESRDGRQVGGREILKARLRPYRSVGGRRL
ncbi:hypothetical protein [Methylobacterium nodulans]|uniref:Uncharacterized protein n=1 Tax=Methylobacterium nodulans (strain LMG 21967 / CNCM I-2342 / ORS 2060) TaxID=460265 RepID=B8ICH5_METNO|nr:hypothetical protein [Methylobacterium nodulans]ACL55563.1 conserved hypothetical protein [Methylobacterium nodulans ORS 2060]